NAILSSTTPTPSLSGKTVTGGRLNLSTIIGAGSSTSPPAPTGLAATAGDTLVSLSWASSTGAATYNVKRSTTSGTGYATIASGVTVTTYTEKSVVNGTTYYYVVSALS